MATVVILCHHFPLYIKKVRASYKRKWKSAPPFSSHFIGLRDLFGLFIWYKTGAVLFLYSQLFIMFVYLAVCTFAKLSHLDSIIQLFVSRFRHCC